MGLAIAVVVGLLGLLAWVLFPQSPLAPFTPWTTDTVDDVAFTYTIRPDGTTHVRQDITLRFAKNTGHHGLQRSIVVQDAYDGSQDITFPVRDITVTSPDDVSTELTTRTETMKDHRRRILVLRIGDPYRTISEPTARYTIEYVQAGLMVPADGGRAVMRVQPFSYDTWARHVSTRVVDERGLADAWCSKSLGRCQDVQRDATTATSTVTGMTPWHRFTVAGTTAQPTPSDRLLVPRTGTAWEAFMARVTDPWLNAIVVPLVLAAALFGGRWWGRRVKDQRYVGLAPGLAPKGESGPTQPDDHPEIPVMFSPPPVPVAAAAMLLDGRPEPHHFAAQLAALQAAGNIRLDDTDDGVPVLTVIDRDGTRLDDISRAVLSDLAEPREPLPLDSPDVMIAHARMVEMATKWVKGRHWVAKGMAPKPAVTVKAAQAAARQLRGNQEKPQGLLKSFFGTLALIVPAACVVGVEAGGVVVGIVMLFLIPGISLLAFGIAGLLLGRWWGASQRRFPRTGRGTAMADQVQGFKRYLATAEAGMLAEAQAADIALAGMPWAVLFDLTDRWTKVCREAIEAGVVKADIPTFEALSTSTSMLGVDPPFATADRISTLAGSSSSSGHSSSGGGGSWFGGSSGSGSSSSSSSYSSSSSFSSSSSGGSGGSIGGW